MDLAQFADLSLDVVLAVAVVALWRKMWSLNDELLAYHKRADEQRAKLLEKQDNLASSVKVWQSEN